jgi:hypothetical protein
MWFFNKKRLLPWHIRARNLGNGFIVNLSANPSGCCCCILNDSKPYVLYRCQRADSLEAAYLNCEDQLLKTEKH